MISPLALTLETLEEHRITKVSGFLTEEDMNQMVELFKQYRDCFAWDYHEND